MHKKYTDLIDEIIKSFGETSKEIINSHFKQYSNGIGIEKYNIETDEQVKKYGRDKGTYTLLSVPDILYVSDRVISSITSHLTRVIKLYLGKLEKRDKVLVVGLGNRHISSDSLGTQVVSKIKVTLEKSNHCRLMAICPSVMGLTGIESYDIVSGVVSKIKPTHIIIIDCLCAGAVERLGKSIQLSDTGICPGSGIGNNRKCIDKGLAKNILSIGVPLLIYANTFLDSACENAGITFGGITGIMQKYKNNVNFKDIYIFAEYVKKLYNVDFENLIVSPKDVGEYVDIMSDLIATSINSVVLSSE